MRAVPSQRDTDTEARPLPQGMSLAQEARHEGISDELSDTGETGVQRGAEKAGREEQHDQRPGHVELRGNEDPEKKPLEMEPLKIRSRYLK